MARGVRSTATLMPLFSPQNQPQSLASYDARTRRNTILIAEIVPTLDISENNSAMALFVPSDRYYVNYGAWDSASRVPPWLQNVTGLTYQTWNSTAKRHYATHAGAATLYGNIAPFIYPTGHCGASSSYTPKNSGVAAVWIKSTVAFTTNGDYGTDGFGANNNGSTAFGTATDHFIQVTRNTANWELGSCDGATISQQASAGGADSSAHEFAVRWSAGELKLYVDDVLVITKTTNLPDRPLKPVALLAAAGVNLIRGYDYYIEWEAA